MIYKVCVFVKTAAMRLGHTKCAIPLRAVWDMWGANFANVIVFPQTQFGPLVFWAISG